MKEDIRICRAEGCDGIVTGILTPDGGVDYERMARLTELAYPMDVTFHRAFDRTAAPLQALEDIIKTGCTRILTSGQQKTAPEGASLINQLISAAEDRIIIMPGSGVRSDNICQLARETGAVEFHSSARRTKNGNMSFFSTRYFPLIRESLPRMNRKYVNYLNNYLSCHEIHFRHGWRYSDYSVPGTTNGKQSFHILAIQANRRKTWHHANVPGNVYSDLFNNKLIPDPLFGDQEYRCYWIDSTGWEYRTIF